MEVTDGGNRSGTNVRSLEGAQVATFSRRPFVNGPHVEFYAIRKIRYRRIAQHGPAPSPRPQSQITRGRNENETYGLLLFECLLRLG